MHFRKEQWLPKGKLFLQYFYVKEECVCVCATHASKANSCCNTFLKKRGLLLPLHILKKKQEVIKHVF